MTMKIALVTDLHVGYTGESHWHNRKMWSDAEAVARAAVQQLNAQSPDLTFVLGDLTESGETQETETVCSILNGFSSPWYVVAGNHDRKALASGDFGRLFADHLLPPYHTHENIGILTLREPWPREDKHVARMDWDLLQPALDTLLAAPPAVLLIIGHYPMLPEKEYAEAHHGLYAGHWVDGETLLDKLTPVLAGRIVVLCGHQHWHHIMQTPAVLHCTTASMTEYPMECRLVTIEDHSIHIQTLDTASPEVAARSLDAATWVRGSEQDRTHHVTLPFPRPA